MSDSSQHHLSAHEWQYRNRPFLICATCSSTHRQRFACSRKRSVASHGGGGKHAKIGTRRLVLQSRTIERYLPTNAKRADTRTAFWPTKKTDVPVRKAAIERVKRRLRCNRLLPE